MQENRYSEKYESGEDMAVGHLNLAHEFFSEAETLLEKNKGVIEKGGSIAHANPRYWDPRNLVIDKLGDVINSIGIAGDFGIPADKIADSEELQNKALRLLGELR